MDIAAVAAPAVSFGDVATLFGESASRVVVPSHRRKFRTCWRVRRPLVFRQRKSALSAGIGSGSPSTAAWRSTSLLPTPKRYGRAHWAYFERTRYCMKPY